MQGCLPEFIDFPSVSCDGYVCCDEPFLEQLGDSEEFSRKEPFESPAQMEQVLQQLDTTISYVISLFREVMEIRDCHTKEHNSDIVELAKKIYRRKLQ